MNEKEALHLSAARHAHSEIANFYPEDLLGKKIKQHQIEKLTQILWLAHYESFIEGNLSNIEPVHDLQDEFN
jgi:hypothetical protein